MSSLKFAIVILTVLCPFLDVLSHPSIRSKIYNHRNEIVFGRQYFRQHALLFTLCNRGTDAAAKLCRIKYDSNVFDETLSEQACEIPVITERSNAYFSEILGINLWGEDKAIFAWRELSKSSIRDGWIIIKTVHLRTCNWTNYTLAVTNRDNMRPQVFITPYANNYEISFNNEDLSRHSFCKLTVDQQGAASNPKPWFSNTDSIYTLLPMDDDSSGSKLVVTNADFGVPRVTFYLWRKSKRTKLMEVERMRNLGWSASNGIISICGPESCARFDRKGKSRPKIEFRPADRPREFATLYNLPNQEILAVVCENSDSANVEYDHYRITKIDSGGRQGRSLNLTDLNCSEKPSFLHMQFFRNSDTDYCLTVFHSMDSANGRKRSKFSRISFTLQDF